MLAICELTVQLSRLLAKQSSTRTCASVRPRPLGRIWRTHTGHAPPHGSKKLTGRRVGRSVSTPASRRTVRETLASYSSHQAYDDVYPRCQCTNNLRLLLAMFLIRRTACAFRLRKRLYFRFAHAIRVALTYAHTEAIASGVYFP